MRSWTSVYIVPYTVNTAITFTQGGECWKFANARTRKSCDWKKKKKEKILKGRRLSRSPSTYNTGFSIRIPTGVQYIIILRGRVSTYTAVVNYVYYYWVFIPIYLYTRPKALCIERVFGRPGTVGNVKFEPKSSAYRRGYCATDDDRAPGA